MATWKQLPALKKAAAILWPDYGEWAYATWERLNREYFENSLQPCGILFGLTAHGHSLAYYRPSDNTITLHTSLLDPKSRSPWGIGSALGERLATDTLLHEMIHQSIAQTGSGTKRDGTSSHNCTSWVNEVKRLSPLLGFDVKAEMVRQRRIDGKVMWAPRDGELTMRELATWPQLLRPKGYYQGR